MTGLACAGAASSALIQQALPAHLLMRCFSMVLLHFQMRGATVPGNMEGTVVRNGAAHRRRWGQAAGAAGKGARRGQSVQGGINKR